MGTSDRGAYTRGDLIAEGAEGRWTTPSRACWPLKSESTSDSGGFLVERGIVLDPGSPLWFDGHLDLPKPGERWKMTLSCQGATASVEFTPTELDTFISGYPTEVVSGRLRQAVAALQKPKPQEHGLA